MKAADRKTVRGGLWRTRARKSMTSMHLVLNLLLLVLLWGMVNFLSMRHYLREDWSGQQATRLAPRTLAVLAEIREPVKLTLLMSREFKGASQVEDLIAELQLRAPLLQVDRVDPERDIGATDALSRRYQITQPDQVILEARGRHRAYPLESMQVMEPEEQRPPGQPPRMIGFRGEAVLTTALMEITRSKRPVVYFLTGHGERDIDNFSSDPAAYSSIREKLESDHLELRILHLEEALKIPADADLLVIAGPRTRISQPEIDQLRTYLNTRGRLLVLLDALADAGLTPLLHEFGVKLAEDVVIDPHRSLRGDDVLISRYGQHPVTAAMQGIRTVFIRPRSVRAAQEEAGADRPRFSVLAASSESGWAELNPERSPPRLDVGVDPTGPVPIAAAVEWSIPGVSEGEGRLVVFGDSLFPGNALNNGGGMLLMRHAVHWLLRQENLLEIPAREVDEIRLMVDRRELNLLLLYAAVWLPGAVAGLGLLVALRRRG